VRLSLQDKNELLLAAVRAPDLDSLRDYVVGLVDAIDSLPDNKSDAQAPPFRRAQLTLPYADAPATRPEWQQNGVSATGLRE
jgi:hypothetical protein